MFKNILVALDGSALAEAALPYAKALGSRTGASLALVRAARNTSPLGDVTYNQQHQTIETAEDYLAGVADELAAQGFNVQTGVPYGGSASEWIVEEGETRHADLIVMATHDRVGPDRWVHGSVAEGVVKHAATPVMLVRGDDADQLAQRFDSQQPMVIVPLDGSELAEAALPIARAFAQALDARAVLVGVVPKSGQFLAGEGGAIVAYGGAQQTETETKAWAYLEASVARVAGLPTPVTIVRHGDPATEIAALAHEYAAAVVVMATHGRTGLVRSILGSVAGGVLHHSSTPVVLIRPPELRAAEEPLVSQAFASPA